VVDALEEQLGLRARLLIADPGQVHKSEQRLGHPDHEHVLRLLRVVTLRAFVLLLLPPLLLLALDNRCQGHLHHVADVVAHEAQHEAIRHERVEAPPELISARRPARACRGEQQSLHGSKVRRMHGLLHWLVTLVAVLACGGGTDVDRRPTQIHCALLCHQRTVGIGVLACWVELRPRCKLIECFDFGVEERSNHPTLADSTTALATATATRITATRITATATRITTTAATPTTITTTAATVTAAAATASTAAARTAAAAAAVFVTGGLQTLTDRLAADKRVKGALDWRAMVICLWLTPHGLAVCL
jgi:hypothetical protein